MIREVTYMVDCCAFDLLLERHGNVAGVPKQKVTVSYGPTVTRKEVSLKTSYSNSALRLNGLKAVTLLSPTFEGVLVQFR